MVTFRVNGTRYSCDDNKKKLISFLREDLRLTSVKNGCEQGACGSCTVVINGKAMRACITRIEKLEGASVITTEGLSEREKEVYTHCFAAAGAVQCGYCIPGMVMSAKALLDVNDNPTPEEIKKALRGNICRCTGYVKIEQAIVMAAAYFREKKEIAAVCPSGKIGENIFRLDAAEKTLGTGEYTDDVVVDGMLYARALRSLYPRARVLHIHTEEALAHPQAVQVFTAKDIPGQNKIGHLKQDWDTIIPEGGITRYIGDTIALAVAQTEEALAEMLSLIKVEYEVLRPLTSPPEAMASGAPEIHEGVKGNILSEEHLQRGDVEAILKTAAHVVTRHYSVPFTEHAFMEPECAIAMPEGEDGVFLYTGGQSIYDEQREIAGMLGIAKEKVHVQSKLVGGGFGGKEDMSVQHHAALAAWLLKKPVKVRFSRQESINVHPKRHAMEMDFTTACDENGQILALKAVLIADTGAYASLGGPVLQRACTHAGGPYNFQNVDILGKAVYTNNPPAGAFRGFGVTQSAFAFEANLNLLAEAVGISPWEIRYRNAVRPGDVLPNGQIADRSTAMAECLLAVKDIYEQAPYAGIASCFKNAGTGVGIPDTGRCLISVETDSRVHIRTSAACIGQGFATVALQMACETTGLRPGQFVVEVPDTTRTPNTGTTTASRQTVLSGEAIVRACQKLKAELDEGASLRDLSGREFYAEFCPPTDPLGSDKPNPVSHVAYGFAVQVVLLNEQGKVEKVVAAYDAGNIVNPLACEGQIEGGIAMGLGYGLTEDYPLEDGYPRAKYGTLGLFRATETPPMEIKLIRKGDYNENAHGSKGVGELATIPTAPALQGAYYKLDGVFRQKLPLENTFYRKAKKVPPKPS